MPASGFRPAITAYLAHENPGTRAALHDEVAGTGITIVGESGNGREALDRIIDLVPDVALLSVDLPELSGPAVCAALRSELPSCRVLLLAARDDDAAYEGLLAGAYGCYLLNDPPMTLVKAVRGTMRRESLPSPGWARRILTEYEDLAAHEEDRIVPAPHLTPTELEVLTRMAESKTPSEIAELHDVTAHLVRLHAGYAIIKLYRGIVDEQFVRAAS